MSSTKVDDHEPGPTSQLSSWVSDLALSDIPEDVITRAKYIILDGLACGLVGAHLPWSEKAAHAILELEPAGDATIIGWDKKIPPMSAALLNSSFIQGFELDDWHSDAPLHSNSILLPALLAAAQHVHKKTGVPVSGKDFLLSTIIGYEIGPRVGLGLYGSHILTTGWHSGAVFGPAAAAAAVSRLLGLNADQVEDAFGIACTQACGLMSAQFGSDAKRMQHGFAARNGLLAAFLAQGGYTGIRSVFEVEYGGFLKQFSSGNGKTPQYLPEEVSKGLGTIWRTNGVRLKPYASMAATHATVDCIRKLQELHSVQMQDITSMKDVKIQMGEASFHHGGWEATRPLSSLGAQMNDTFVAATQIIHGQVLPAQFRQDMLEHDEVWRLVDRTHCEQDASIKGFGQTVTIEFVDGNVLSHSVEAARGVSPPLSNDEIVEKCRLLTKEVADERRVAEMEAAVLNLDHATDITPLLELLSGVTRNPIE